ncbi:MAG: RNA-binding cell elongation regulator Jag/EloR [Christensenellales bacterium]|jgi:spoIIIJ-associated protein
MSNTVEVSAKTVEAAVEQALKALGMTKEQVDIQVLEEGSRGILGIGSRDAKVAVKPKVADDVAVATAFIENTARLMGLEAQVTAFSEEDALRIQIAGKNMGTLIGYHGETLDALQYLTSLVVNHKTKDYRRVTLDTENYRAKRAESLSRLAGNMARKAIRVGRVALEPMNPYERRILHTALQNNDRVETHSEGEEPYRRVIIIRK